MITLPYHQLLNRIFRLLLIGSDGKQRSLTASVTIKSGKSRTVLGRVFYKKNGQLRPYLNKQIRVLFEGNEITKWIREFDSPTSEFLKFISNNLSEERPILLVFPLGKNLKETEARANSAALSVGVSFHAIIFTGAQSDDSSKYIVSRIFSSRGIPVVEPEQAKLENFRYLLWLGEGAILRQHGAWLLANRISSAPACIAVYSDTAILGKHGLQSTWFKPDFSPELSKTVSLLGEVFMVRIESARPAFLKRDQMVFDTLTRNAFERSLAREVVEHVPNCCYFMSDTHYAVKPAVVNRAKAAQVTNDQTPSVTIIIPTRDRWDLLEPCIQSVHKSAWPAERLEIIVVDNGSDEQETLFGLNRLAASDSIQLLRVDAPFNYSQLNNIAAAQAKGSILVFLNNDTVIIDLEWLTKLTRYASLPKAGAVGAKLLYPDNTVQHAGVVLGINGGAGHAFVGIAPDDTGYNGIAIANREISAVTGACLAVRREVFLQSGGFDENLRVAYNDIAFCSRLIELGFQNYIVEEPLLVHYESKSRGFNTTRSKQLADLKEAIYARRRFNTLWSVDPFYSPNLSLRNPYAISEFPRRRSPWIITTDNRQHILILSSAHQRGYGVPVVIDRHVKALIKAGCRVTVGGPIRSGDYPYDGAKRLQLHEAEGAARWALCNGVDLVWAHTPPFYSCARWLDGQIPIYAYDYGEPSPNFFPDWRARVDINLEKTFAMAMCDQTHAISEAVLQESMIPLNGVIPLGNDHLSIWNSSFEKIRQTVRERYYWNDKQIVLNVCRFTSGEQRYKGLDTYLEVMRQFCIDTSQIDGQVLFVLCGKGTESDVDHFKAAGLEVFANISDDELIELYAAADIYANFSRWEGYNLGIGQALAMGLDVVASDTAAHRAFGVDTFSEVRLASRAIAEKLALPRQRIPRIWSWSTHEEQVVEASRPLKYPSTPTPP